VVNLVEKTKILDSIYIKYGVKMAHMTLAAEKYFTEDQDVKTAINAIQMTQKKVQDEREK